MKNRKVKVVIYLEIVSKVVKIVRILLISVQIQ